MQISTAHALTILLYSTHDDSYVRTNALGYIMNEEKFEERYVPESLTFQRIQDIYGFRF